MRTEADFELYHALRDYYGSVDLQQRAVQAALAHEPNIDDPEILRVAYETFQYPYYFLVDLLERGANPNVTIRGGRYDGMSLLGMSCMSRSHEGRDLLFAAGARLTEFDKAWISNPDNVGNPDWPTQPFSINDALCGIENEACPGRYKLPTQKMLMDYYQIDFDTKTQQKNLKARQEMLHTKMQHAAICAPVAYEGIIRFDARERG